jgi:hypothetical protein
MRFRHLAVMGLAGLTAKFGMSADDGKVVVDGWAFAD